MQAVLLTQGDRIDDDVNQFIFNVKRFITKRLLGRQILEIPLARKQLQSRLYSRA